MRSKTLYKLVEYSVHNLVVGLVYCQTILENVRSSVFNVPMSFAKIAIKDTMKMKTVKLKELLKI